jgi:hypothetical protein
MARLASAVPTQADDTELSIPFVITTSNEDRDGDVVVPMGIQLHNYSKNPVCFFGHQQYQNHPLPIAKCKSPDGRITVFPEENQARCVMYFDRDDEFAVKCYQKVKSGFLNATSIAFVPIQAQRRDREAEKGLYENRAHTHNSPMTPAGWLFAAVDLTEVSVVGVPANAGAIRDWMDTDKGLNDVQRKSLMPYAAKANKSFSGWCPAGTVACPDGACRPVAKGLAIDEDLRNPDTDKPSEPEEVPIWDAIVDGKPWSSVKAFDAETAKWIVQQEIDRVRRKEMPPDYTECQFRERFPKPKIAVKGPYKVGGKRSKVVKKELVEQRWFEIPEAAVFEYDGPIEQQPPQERWNKSLSAAFDAMPELQMEDSGKVGVSTTHRVAMKYLGCQVKDLHQSSTMVPAPRMGSFLTGLKLVLSEYKCVEVRNISDRSESPLVYETIQVNSKSRDNFLVRGMMFMESVAPRGKRANPRQMFKVLGELGKGSGPHNNYGQGVGDKRFVLKMSPEWGGLSVTVLTKRADAEMNQSIFDKSWAWARENNFLKGEAFALSGEFLPRTAESWDDVFLDEKNSRPLRRTIDLLNKKGLGFANRGIILCGPPGTGKTLSGRIIRNQAKATFIWVSSRDFHASGSVGGLSGAFDMAKELAPAVVFMEDVDNWLDGRSIDLLKSEMDGIARSKGVLTILTTNFPEQLPEALIDRPGRFHDVHNFDLPVEQARRDMLRKWLPDVPQSSIESAVEKSAGYSGAHVYELAHFAKTLNEQDDMSPVEAVTEALAKVESQRELITKLQLSGSNYDPLRNSRRNRIGAPIKMKELPAMVTKGLGAVGCKCGGSCGRCSKSVAKIGPTAKPGEGGRPITCPNCGKKYETHSSEGTRQQCPYCQATFTKTSGKGFEGRGNRGGANQLLPTRPVEDIFERMAGQLKQNPQLLASPEFSAWKREVTEHYVNLRTADRRMEHRRALEQSYDALVRAARAQGVKLGIDRSLFPPDGTKSVRNGIKAARPKSYVGRKGLIPDPVHYLPTKQEAQKYVDRWRQEYPNVEAMIGQDQNGWFVKPKVTKQLSEVSGTAGGYTVPVSTSLGETAAPTDAVCPQCQDTGSCAECDGAGMRDGRPCEVCGGTGECPACVESQVGA